MKLATNSNVIVMSIILISYLTKLTCLAVKHGKEDIIMHFSDKFSRRIRKMNITNEVRSKIARMTQFRKIPKVISTNSSSNYTFSKRLAGGIDIYSGEVVAKERNIRLFVSLHNGCNVMVNDTVRYEHNSKQLVNYVEHTVLHNNADFIEPKAVLSENGEINYYTYNHKLNVFSVFFDKINKRKNSFTINYNYNAVNLIKSKRDHDSPTDNNNTLVWKIYNENPKDVMQKLKIEILFSLDRLFESEDVSFFAMNFSKKIATENNERYVIYSWNGEVKPQEVFIVGADFPEYFENCMEIRFNWPMIFVGAGFIVILILVLYLLVSQIVLKEDL